jgi:hypothetical protein
MPLPAASTEARSFLSGQSFTRPPNSCRSTICALATSHSIHQLPAPTASTEWSAEKSTRFTGSPQSHAHMRPPVATSHTHAFLC